MLNGEHVITWNLKKLKHMYNYTKEVSSRLNDLLEKNYDAEKGFKKAAENADSSTLKSYFETKSDERRRFGHQLKAEIKGFGEEVDKGGSATGSAHRTWMDVKSWFSADNDEAMLNAAIRGEKAALEEYDELLESREPHIPEGTKSVLVAQRNMIDRGLSTIKSLEEMK